MLKFLKRTRINKFKVKYSIDIAIKLNKIFLE